MSSLTCPRRNVNLHNWRTDLYLARNIVIISSTLSLGIHYIQLGIVGVLACWMPCTAPKYSVRACSSTALKAGQSACGRLRVGWQSVRCIPWLISIILILALLRTIACYAS
eukprot:8745191-Pyramimonas_sp.AAC.1